MGRKGKEIWTVEIGLCSVLYPLVKILTSPFMCACWSSIAGVGGTAAPAESVATATDITICPGSSDPFYIES